MTKSNTISNAKLINGTRVNCGTNRPIYTKILEMIYVMAFVTSRTFNRPIGFHMRVRFSSLMTAGSFSARLTTYYVRKSSYNPLRVCAAEIDPIDGYIHYHYALILDAKHDKILSIKYLLSELQKSGYLHDYHIKGHDDAKWGLPLNNTGNIEKYIYWLSYIAKTRSKPTDRQTHSASHAVVKDTNIWIKSGRPQLNIDSREASHPLAHHTLAGFFDDFLQ